MILTYKKIALLVKIPNELLKFNSPDLTLDILVTEEVDEPIILEKTQYGIQRIDTVQSIARPAN